MNLYLHESIHFTLSLMVGFVIWRISGNFYAILIALAGGFFVDLDHLIDYFLAFGFKFNLAYFLKGYSFLKTDKIYVVFHSWELAIISLSISLFFFSQPANLINFTISVFLLSFSLSLFLHLVVDVFTNDMKVRAYFLLYRINNNFELKTMITKEHYKKHLRQKSLIN